MLSALMENLSAVESNSQILQDFASSCKNLRDFSETKKNTHPAPPVLQTSGRTSAWDQLTPDTDSKLSFDFNNLPLFKVEPMTRIERATYALRKRCSTD